MGDWWQQIGIAWREDFSDLPDVSQATRVVWRLILAALLAGLVGYEREKSGKSAGLRTHMIVGLGAALFMLVPQQIGASPAGLTRVLQGLVAGIGFLGAGAIMKSKDDDHISGLTTAAGIWLTAAIGVAAGLGRELTAILGAVLAFVVLKACPHVTPPDQIADSTGQDTPDNKKRAND